MVLSKSGTSSACKRGRGEGRGQHEGRERRGIPVPGGARAEIDLRHPFGLCRLDPVFLGRHVLFRNAQARVVLQGEPYGRFEIEGHLAGPAGRGAEQEPETDGGQQREEPVSHSMSPSFCAAIRSIA